MVHIEAVRVVGARRCLHRGLDGKTVLALGAKYVERFRSSRADPPAIGRVRGKVEYSINSCTYIQCALLAAVSSEPRCPKCDEVVKSTIVPFHCSLTGEIGCA